jgi:hypothetical protein
VEAIGIGAKLAHFGLDVLAVGVLNAHEHHVLRLNSQTPRRRREGGGLHFLRRYDDAGWRMD